MGKRMGRKTRRMRRRRARRRKGDGLVGILVVRSSCTSEEETAHKLVVVIAEGHSSCQSRHCGWPIILSSRITNYLVIVEENQICRCRRLALYANVNQIQYIGSSGHH